MMPHYGMAPVVAGEHQPEQDRHPIIILKIINNKMPRCGIAPVVAGEHQPGRDRHPIIIIIIIIIINYNAALRHSTGCRRRAAAQARQPPNYNYN